MANDDADKTARMVAMTRATERDGEQGVERYRAGWRAGKPVEDPDKTKRWGVVAARPSEYLVCTRRGQVDRKRSGQGARVFKWPWEAIAIVPTTLQRIEFVADQVTRERVGVKVAGIAVYRIAEPELAFRVLNFTFGEAANEKLATTLREMFIGASRRLIANLTLEECLTRRKEAIGEYLMQEIAPVVGGTGTPGDVTSQGWGVVIDTIEIQDVVILSDDVFAHLQAPFRAEIAARAELAELDRARQVAERRAETERRSEEAQLLTQRETRALRARTEAEAAETEAGEQARAERARSAAAAEAVARKEALARRELEMQEGLAVRKADGDAALARRQAELARARVLAEIAAVEERRRATAEAEVAAMAAEAARTDAAHAEAMRALAREAARAEQAQVAELAQRQRAAVVDGALRADEVATRRLEQEAEAAQQRRLAEIEELLVHGRVLRELVSTGLPRLATAFQQSFGQLHYTQIGGGDGGGGPSTPVAQAIAQVLAVARSFGLDPAALTARRGGAPVSADVSADD
jgi:flotillin